MNPETMLQSTSAEEVINLGAIVNEGDRVRATGIEEAKQWDAGVEREEIAERLQEVRKGKQTLFTQEKK